MTCGRHEYPVAVVCGVSSQGGLRDGCEMAASVYEMAMRWL